MSKVKLTKRQASMISNHKNHLERLITKRYNANCATSVDDLSFDDILSAYFEGYEVEEEFKVGDWVATKYTISIGKITEIVSKTGDGWLNFDNGIGDAFEAFRHATEEEIAKEKQRRFWRSNNRDVWELKKGDVLSKDKRIMSTVAFVDSIGVTFNEFGIFANWHEIKKYYEVACFAHDRKDLNND